MRCTTATFGAMELPGLVASPVDQFDTARSAPGSGAEARTGADDPPTDRGVGDASQVSS